MHSDQLYSRNVLLRRYRKKLDMSIEQVAKKLNVMTPEYQAFEEGRIETHPDFTLEDLVYYFDHMIRAKGLDGSQKVHMDRQER